MKQTAKDLIIRFLSEQPTWVAVHEMRIEGYSQNCVATRLPEMERAGRVVGRVRGGKRFKEWALSSASQGVS